MSIYAPVDGTTERLLALADAIEQHPEYHNQGAWVKDPDRLIENPMGFKGKGIYGCGTTFCIAGGLVLLTPDGEDFGYGTTDDEGVRVAYDWAYAGQLAGGLEPDLADAIFSPEYKPDDMPSVLRIIASVPEGERTVRAVIEAGLKELQGANLIGVDLRGLDLTGVDFDMAWRAAVDNDIPGWVTTLEGNSVLRYLIREDKAKELGLVTP